MTAVHGPGTAGAEAMCGDLFLRVCYCYCLLDGRASLMEFLFWIPKVINEIYDETDGRRHPCPQKIHSSDVPFML